MSVPPESSVNLREEIHKFMVTRGVENFYCVLTDPDDERSMITARGGNCIWWAGALTIELDDVRIICGSDLMIPDDDEV